VGDLLDLEEERAKRMGPRRHTSIAAEPGRIVVTFPRAIEQLELTPEKAQFWVDTLTTLLATAKASTKAE
jgi:hypothetical protein